MAYDEEDRRDEIKKKKTETGGKIEGLILNRASGLPGDDDARERRRRN